MTKPRRGAISMHLTRHIKPWPQFTHIGVFVIAGLLTACSGGAPGVPTAGGSELPLQTTSTSTAKGGSLVAGASAQPRVAPRATNGAIWSPTTSDTFQWELDNTNFDMSIPATVYDVDGFDTSASQVAALHQLGRHVVCYIDVGTLETWRPDASEFVPPSIIGNADPGWSDEYYLDIRQLSVLEPIMTARFQMCQQKGFDAVEPDNIDGYENDTGFPLTAQDQLTYNEWVATEVHSLGMSVAQKNDPDQVRQLLPYFDFALQEECFYDQFCNEVTPYAQANKAVFDVEYNDDTPQSTFETQDCPAAASYGYYAILKDETLDDWIVSCTSNGPMGTKSANVSKRKAIIHHR
jgi:hypothetical protein